MATLRWEKTGRSILQIFFINNFLYACRADVQTETIIYLPTTCMILHNQSKVEAGRNRRLFEGNKDLKSKAKPVP